MIYGLLVALAFCLSAAASPEDITQWVADRTAIERVYYNHRTGEKPPFESILPEKAVQELLRTDMRKEAALGQGYHFNVTPAMVEAESRRIEATTKAPDVLVELKAAVGNDPARFARAVVRPIVVDRELRRHFEADDQIQFPIRRNAEKARADLLAARGKGIDDEVALLNHSYSNEVVTNIWILAKPSAEPDTQKSYFADLPAELQTVLQAQLLKPTDVSAVIEMPKAFLVCVLVKKSDDEMQVVTLNLPKMTYDRWLNVNNNLVK